MEQAVSLSETLTMSDAQSISWDVVVIGAGVAGAVAAREVARAGHRVLLVDKRSFPRRKVCGACLNGVALEVLAQIGLSREIEALDGPRLRGFAVRCGSRSVKLSLPEGLAISREALDATLVRAAVEAGVAFLPNSVARVGEDDPSRRFVRLTQNGREICLDARAIVVASGLEGLGLPDSNEWRTRVGTSSRVGAGCVIDDASADYAPGTIWMAVGAGGYAGLVRVEDGRLNIAAAFDRKFLRRHGSPATATQQLLEASQFPVPRQLLSADWQGTVALTRDTVPVASRRVFLIGDAASYVEPFTGEGMAWALLSGQHVARWVGQSLAQSNWSPDIADGWNGEHRRLVQRRQRFCRVSMWLLRSPMLIKVGLSALASWPWLARQIIERVNVRNDQGRLAYECKS